MDRIDVQQPRPLRPADADRLDRLFRLHHSQLVAFAATQVRTPADADDVASETWVRAAVCIGQLRAADADAFGWLRSIAARAAVDLYRPRRASEQPRDWADAVAVRALPAVPPAETDSPALVLADLTAQQCTAVKLAAQGLSHGAIAARLGKSRQAVQQNLKGGARRLRAAVGIAEPRPKRRRPARVPAAIGLALSLAALLPAMACSDSDGASIAEQQAADALAQARIAAANAAAAAAEAAREAAERLRNGGR